MSRHFGELSQNGYVVRDPEAAMLHWTETVGVGPFFYIERVPFGEFRYRGEPSAVEVSVAVAACGPVQIELIALRDNSRSMWQDFLSSGHEGLQHVSYWTKHFDADLQSAIARAALRSGSRAGSARLPVALSILPAMRVPRGRRWSSLR